MSFWSDLSPDLWWLVEDLWWFVEDIIGYLFFAKDFSKRSLSAGFE